jgi:hypothetical protein
MEHVDELDLRSVCCPNEGAKLSVAKLLYGAEATVARMAHEAAREDDPEDKVSRRSVLVLRH